MSDDLVSLRMLLVTAARSHQDFWREGAAQASMPIDFEAGDAATAKAALAKGGVDICVLDAALTDADKAGVIKAARAGQPPPLVFMSAPRGSARMENVDGVLIKPAHADDVRKQVDICIRVKIPTRVLVVEDAATTLSVVRKVLSASRFTLDIHDASEAAAALDQMRTGKFEIVFLDSQMPGTGGGGMLPEIKRENPKLPVVMMTSAPEKSGSKGANSKGAIGVLKKPFYPADVDAVLERFYGLQVPG